MEKLDFAIKVGQLCFVILLSAAICVYIWAEVVQTRAIELATDRMAASVEKNAEDAKKFFLEE